MSTAAEVKVFGAAQVWVGTGSGTGNARLLQYLGLTESGVICRHRKHFGEVRVDTGLEGGPPAELQHGLEDAEIAVDLSQWSQTILDLIDVLGIGGNVKGAMPVAGRIVGTNNDAFSLAIVPPSGSTMSPRWYQTAILKNNQEIKLGTKYSVAKLGFYAWPFIPAKKVAGFPSPFASTAGAAVLSSSGAVLYIDGSISGGAFDSATVGG